MPRVVDTHAHLDEIENLAEAVAEAKQAGVVAVIAVGVDDESNRRVLELARDYAGFVFPALGLHPGNFNYSTLDHSLEFIESNIDKAVALGEIGLDYHKRVRAMADKDIQKQVLQKVLLLAKKYNKPVSIHSRYAWRDALTLVEEAGIERVVFHWYTGPSSVLRDIIAQGYYLSATPAVDYHYEHKRAIKEAPLEKLLLETDSPVTYHPAENAGYTAMPVHVMRSLSGAALLKGVSDADVAEVTTENAFDFFGLQR